jgi:hypothetical protein
MELTTTTKPKPKTKGKVFNMTENAGVNIHVSPEEMEILKIRRAQAREANEEVVRCETVGSIGLSRPAPSFPEDVRTMFDDGLNTGIARFKNNVLPPGIVLDLRKSVFEMFERKGRVKRVKDKTKLTPFDEIEGLFGEWMRENKMIGEVKFLRGAAKLNSPQRDRLASLEKILRDKGREIPRVPRDDE